MKIKSIKLTQKENMVLEKLAHGLSYEQIARQMNIKQPTLRMHIASIFQKLILKGHNAKINAVLLYLKQEGYLAQDYFIEGELCN